MTGPCELLFDHIMDRYLVPCTCISNPVSKLANFGTAPIKQLNQVQRLSEKNAATNSFKGGRLDESLSSTAEPRHGFLSEFEVVYSGEVVKGDSLQSNGSSNIISCHMHVPTICSSLIKIQCSAVEHTRRMWSLILRHQELKSLMDAMFFTPPTGDTSMICSATQLELVFSKLGINRRTIEELSIGVDDYLPSTLSRDVRISSSMHSQLSITEKFVDLMCRILKERELLMDSKEDLVIFDSSWG